MLDSFLNPCRARVEVAHKDLVPAIADFPLALGTNDALEGTLTDKVKSGPVPVAVLLANENSRSRSSKNFSRLFCSLSLAFSAVNTAAHTAIGMCIFSDIVSDTLLSRSHLGRREALTANATIFRNNFHTRNSRLRCATTHTFKR